MATEVTLRDVLDRIDRFEQDNTAQHKELAEGIAGMRGEWGLFKWVVGIFLAPMPRTSRPMRCSRCSPTDPSYPSPAVRAADPPATSLSNG